MAGEKRKPPSGIGRLSTNAVLFSYSSKFNRNPTGQVNQADSWQRLNDVVARIVERLRRQRDLDMGTAA